MLVLRQILAVTWLNLRNLPQRIASSAVAIVGVAAVVLVFSAVLSMAKGFERTMVSAGSEDTAIVLRRGATSELNSGLSNEQMLIVSNAPGVMKDGDAPIISAELYVVVDVKTASDNVASGSEQLSAGAQQMARDEIARVGGQRRVNRGHRPGARRAVSATAAKRLRQPVPDERGGNDHEGKRHREHEQRDEGGNRQGARGVGFQGAAGNPPHTHPPARPRPRPGRWRSC